MTKAKAKRPPRKTTTKAKPKPPSYLETRFLLLWSEVAKGTGFSTLEAEVSIPPRKFRWDFRIPGTQVLIECNGGTFHRRRLGHSSAAGIQRDYQKSNYAQMKGWQQFTFDTKMVNEHELQALFEYVCKKYPDRVG